MANAQSNGAGNPATVTLEPDYARAVAQHYQYAGTAWSESGTLTLPYSEMVDLAIDLMLAGADMAIHSNAVAGLHGLELARAQADELITARAGIAIVDQLAP